MGILAHGVFALKAKTRLLVAVLVFAALIGVVFWRGLDLISSEKRIEVSPNAESKSTASVLSALSEANKDSDNDGLKDWEETILRTDPNKADSDGDGTPDGEEIAKNRDPLKKGPNDTLSNPYPLTPSPSPDDNLTYSLTKNLLESGVLNSIDAQGNFRNTDFLKNISLPNELNGLELLRQAAIVHTGKLIVAPHGNAKTVRDYFNALSLILAKHLNTLTEDDLTVLNDAVRSNNPARLNDLDRIIAALEASFREAQSLVVPRGYEGFAVRELNYLLMTKRAVEIEKNFYADPLAAAVVLQTRLVLMDEIKEHHNATKLQLEAVGIVFTASDDAAQLFSL